MLAVASLNRKVTAQGIRAVRGAGDYGIPAVVVEHGADVNNAIFSPDGSYIVSSSRDGTARVTRVSDGAEVVRVEHGDWV